MSAELRSITHKKPDDFSSEHTMQFSHSVVKTLLAMSHRVSRVLSHFAVIKGMTDI